MKNRYYRESEIHEIQQKKIVLYSGPKAYFGSFKNYFQA